MFHSNVQATVGSVSNNEHHFTVFGKAGIVRWLDFRSVVREEAMNPIDHPYGWQYFWWQSIFYAIVCSNIFKGKPTRKKPRNFIANY